MACVSQGEETELPHGMIPPKFMQLFCPYVREHYSIQVWSVHVTSMQSAQ